MDYSFIPSTSYPGDYHYYPQGQRGPGYYFVPHPVATNMTRAGSNQASVKLFHQSSYFQGHMPGYVFTTRGGMTGYYLDQ